MAKDPGKSNRVNKTSYGTKYPYNKVTVTESGHEIHWDDTPGSERIRISHKDGSYFEISPGGKKVEYIVGHDQKYNKGGFTLTVDENHDVKVAGHSRELIGGGKHSEIAGDSKTTIGGHSQIAAAGNMKLGVAGFCQISVQGNCNLNVAGDANMKVAGNMSMDVSGDMGMKVGGSTTMETSGDHTIKASNIRMNP